jgi:hypothetical protein
MVALFIALAAPVRSSPAEAAIELCKPVLARKVHGEIADIDIDRNRATRSRRTIEGELTAFVRMGPAPPGVARANHVIRVEYLYRCRIEHGRVQSASARLRQ